jgi:hypothetical protein
MTEMTSKEWWDDVGRKIIGSVIAALIMLVVTGVLTWYFTSQSAHAAGEKLGYQKGEAAGFAEAMKQCKDKELWLKQGRDEGRREGFENGRKEGLELGQTQGREEGFQAGKDEGLRIGGQYSLTRFLSRYEQLLQSMGSALAIYKDNQNPAELVRSVSSFLGALEIWAGVLEKLSHFLNGDVAALRAELAKNPPDFAEIERLINKLRDNFPDRRDATIEELKKLDQFNAPPMKPAEN